MGIKKQPGPLYTTQCPMVFSGNDVDSKTMSKLAG